MVTITNGKKIISIKLLEIDEHGPNDVTKKIIPTGMFPLDPMGDYVADINECIRRASEWVNESDDWTGMRTMVISNHKEV